MSKDIPVVSIIGKQNTGKTTLISLIVPLLKKKGYKIGTIKYNIPSFEIDYKGKDTYRHYQAGADVVSISSSKKLAIVKRVSKKSPSIQTIIESNYQDIDVVLVEGYKHWRYPYIEIQNNLQQRNSKSKADKHHLRIISTANTHPLVPAFTENDLKNAIHFIESTMK